MGRRPNAEMAAIVDAIKEEVRNQQNRKVLDISAQELAREFDVHAQTITAILRDMGLEFDGKFWYWKAQ